MHRLNQCAQTGWRINGTRIEQHTGTAPLHIQRIDVGAFFQHLMQPAWIIHRVGVGRYNVQRGRWYRPGVGGAQRHVSP